MYDQAGLPPPLAPPHVVSKTRLRHDGEGDMAATATRGAAHPSGRAPIHINWKAR